MSNIYGTAYLAPATADLSGIDNNPDKKGDFIGFTFDGTHSSVLGIVRVSDGSRYQETLLPEFSNKTVNVPGSNRTDYMGMEYTQRIIPISFAFDNVTESQLRDIKSLFSTKTPRPFVFDESPYKTYYVKANSSPRITYLCFDESEQNNGKNEYKRIYKGEGTIDLISFFPYGFCNPRTTNFSAMKNIDEWEVSSGLDGILDQDKKVELDDLEVYNCGDFETPFWVELQTSQLPDGFIKLWDNNADPSKDEPINVLRWEKSGDMKDDFPKDDLIIIDGRTQLIEGYQKINDSPILYKKTGRIYNKFIKEGNWFNLPTGGNLNIRSSGIEKINYNILYI